MAAQICLFELLRQVSSLMRLLIALMLEVQFNYVHFSKQRLPRGTQIENLAKNSGTLRFETGAVE